MGAPLKSTEKIDEARLVIDQLRVHLSTVNDALSYLAKEGVRIAIQTLNLEAPDQKQPNKIILQQIKIYLEIGETPNYDNET